MQIEIEVYKGQTIYYDDDADKFICQINMNDKYKETKRSSLKDVRKEIDAFQKLNLEFKPFKAILASRYSFESFEIVDIAGIRTDGKLVAKFKGRTRVDLLDSEDFGRLKVFDNDLMDLIKKLDEQFESQRKRHEKEKKEIVDRFKTIDLSEYSAILKINADEKTGK